MISPPWDLTISEAIDRPSPTLDLFSDRLLSILDDGPGIPQEEYENITKPFYKIDKSRSEKKSSVGLGLSIVSDIVRSHGGDITFAKSKFGGLEVAISLPF